jgi:hypothetical protein
MTEKSIPIPRPESVAASLGISAERLIEDWAGISYRSTLEGAQQGIPSLLGRTRSFAQPTTY